MRDTIERSAACAQPSTKLQSARAGKGKEMKNFSKALLVSLGMFLLLAVQVRAEPEAKPEKKPEIKNKVLLSEDTKQALSAFDDMMRGKQPEWDELFILMHYYPKRYALLMTGLNASQRQKSEARTSHPYRLYSEYLYKRTEESQEFARKSALSWKVGWNFTCADMTSKLLIKGFPSTRRVALEFLKMENNEETFGYDWKPEPNAKDPAIQKWKVWSREHCKDKGQDKDKKERVSR